MKKWWGYDDENGNVGDDGGNDVYNGDGDGDDDDEDNVSLGIISKLSWSQLELNSIQCIKLQLN